MSLPKAIDVSRYQGVIDFEKVKASGVVLVIAKATEGLTHVDPMFHRNRKECHRVGLAFGAYHYARPDLGHEPELEAAHFLRTLLESARELEPNTNECLLPNEIPPALDLERRDWPKDVQRKERASIRREWAEDFLRYIGNHTYRIPLLYVGTSYLRWQLGGGGDLHEWARLWIKRYWYHGVHRHRMESPGQNQCGPWEKLPAPPFTIYQYSGKGSCPGVNSKVDRNVLAPDWRERLGVAG